jgi:hypothetical protein
VDLQSTPFGHSGTCPFELQIAIYELKVLVIPKSHILILLSHLSESNQRPTDYKSVALPAELKWLVLSFFKLTTCQNRTQEPTDYPAGAGLYQLS